MTKGKHSPKKSKRIAAKISTHSEHSFLSPLNEESHETLHVIIIDIKLNQYFLLGCVMFFFLIVCKIFKNKLFNCLCAKKLLILQIPTKSCFREPLAGFSKLHITVQSSKTYFTKSSSPTAYCTPLKALTTYVSGLWKPTTQDICSLLKPSSVLVATVQSASIEIKQQFFVKSVSVCTEASKNYF